MAEEAKIHQIKKVGESYVVDGSHEGRKSSVTIDAKTFESMSSNESEKLIKRGLESCREDKIRKLCHEQGVPYQEEPRRR